jgi:Flp pilus assembly protein TadB
VTPHHNPFATVEALRRAARARLAEGDRAAARRTLLDALILEPRNTAVRRDLNELMRRAPGDVPHGAGVGALVAVALACAVLATVSLIAGLDVTAVLLAVAGLYTGVLVARRRRRVA